jgi:hypothetical protein
VIAISALGRRKWRSLWRPNINSDTPEGRQARKVLVQTADVEQRKTNEMIGAELGYRYVDSPIIFDIPGGPEHLFREYEPTTWPGARLPNVWLDDGRPLQDRLADGYSILKLASTKVDVTPLGKALLARNAPVDIVEIPDRIARDIYGFDIILVRPDMHIVWRGNEMPEDVAAVADTATDNVVNSGAS